MKKILIVDDEPQFAEMVKIRLEANGYDVLLANDGQKGVALVKKENPDLILMDIMMPNMNGGDAVRLLKADSNLSSIPIIFMTAVVTKDDEKMIQGINIEEVFYPTIAKPFNADELFKKIKKAIGE